MGPATTSTSLGRLDGAKSILDKNGIALDKGLLFNIEFAHDGGYSGFVRLMRAHKRPTAVFCANDVIAIGALDAARKMGLDVPGDVSITGVDDIPMASWSVIALTTVRQPVGDIGSKAAKLISEAVERGGQYAPTRHIFPTNLVQRKSTGRALRVACLADTIVG